MTIHLLILLLLSFYYFLDCLYLGAPFSFSLTRIGDGSKKKKRRWIFTSWMEEIAAAVWAKRKEEGESLVSVMVKIYCPVRIHCRPFVNAANFEKSQFLATEMSRISHFFQNTSICWERNNGRELGQDHRRNPQIELVKCCVLEFGVKQDFSTLYIDYLWNSFSFQEEELL